MELLGEEKEEMKRLSAFLRASINPLASMEHCLALTIQPKNDTALLPAIQSSRQLARGSCYRFFSQAMSLKIEWEKNEKQRWEKIWGKVKLGRFTIVNVGYTFTRYPAN